MNKKIDPTFYILAQNIMKSVSPDKVSPSARKTIQKYVAEGLQNIVTSVNFSYSLDELCRVELSLVLLHGYNVDLDIKEDIIEILESAGVETEKTPGQIIFQAPQAPQVLNRFSGMNINE